MTRDALTFLDEWRSATPTVTVQTSGSTGRPKTMTVEKERMRASARATCQFLRLPQGATALLCMPTRYIAGKMMIVRAEVWPLTLVTVEPSLHPLASLTDTPYFAAMTPAQAYASLQVEEERRRLLAIPRILLGGGAISEELEQAFSGSTGEVWSSYGMTETLSHIALRRVGCDEPYYRPLPGVKVGLNDEGCLWIDAPLICAARQQTHDLAEILPCGDFRILGRIDNVVCSGGVKLQLETLEAQFATAFDLRVGDDFLLTWVADKQWGQALTLLLRQALHHTPEEIHGALPYLKYIYIIKELPLTPTGKPARQEAHRLAETLTTA